MVETLYHDECDIETHIEDGETYTVRVLSEDEWHQFRSGEMVVEIYDDGTWYVVCGSERIYWEAREDDRAFDAETQFPLSLPPQDPDNMDTEIYWPQFGVGVVKEEPDACVGYAEDDRHLDEWQEMFNSIYYEEGGERDYETTVQENNDGAEIEPIMFTGGDGDGDESPPPLSAWKRGETDDESHGDSGSDDSTTRRDDDDEDDVEDRFVNDPEDVDTDELWEPDSYTEGRFQAALKVFDLFKNSSGQTRSDAQEALHLLGYHVEKQYVLKSGTQC